MISQYLGFDSDYIIIGLAALVFNTYYFNDYKCSSNE